MPTLFRPAHFGKFTSVVLLFGLFAGAAHGQGTVVATYLNTDPAAPFAFKTAPEERFVEAWKAQKGQFARKAGRLQWRVPTTEFHGVAL